MKSAHSNLHDRNWAQLHQPSPQDNFQFSSLADRKRWLAINTILLAAILVAMGMNIAFWVSSSAGVIPLAVSAKHLTVMVILVVAFCLLVKARPDHDDIKRWCNGEQ